jgi:hypothetical protein
MPRRASSSTNPFRLIAVLAALAAVGAGGFQIYKKMGDPFRTLTPLDVPAYMENSNSLRGNVYKMTGVIAAKLAWSQTGGSLYSVEAGTGDGSNPLPLLVPAEFNYVNIQKGQKFIFRVEVGDTGVLIARGIEKA